MLEHDFVSLEVNGRLIWQRLLLQMSFNNLLHTVLDGNHNGVSTNLLRRIQPLRF
jgi:hypothetical protein